MNKLTVLVADDHAILRAGLTLLINQQPDMQVVGEATHPDGVLQSVCEGKCNIVTLDLCLSGHATYRTIEAIRRKSPETRVVILATYAEPALLNAAMSVGASGCVLKRSDYTEVLSAIRSVGHGGTHIDPNVSLTGNGEPGDPGSPGGADSEPHQKLSTREYQVLKLVSDGYTNQEIAERLVLSVKTIETHRARLMKKLGLNTRAELIRYARDSGVLAY